MYMYIQSCLQENLLLTMQRKWESAELSSWLGVRNWVNQVSGQFSWYKSPNTLSFLTLITKRQSHSGFIAGHFLLCKIALLGLHYWLTIRHQA